MDKGNYSLSTKDNDNQYGAGFLSILPLFFHNYFVRERSTHSGDKIVSDSSCPRFISGLIGSRLLCFKYNRLGSFQRFTNAHTLSCL